MPFDNDLDDFAPPMEVQRVAPARVGSKAQPVHVVALNPGRAPFQTPADVTYDMMADMRNILAVPKNIHFQGTTGYKTANATETRKLIRACFSLNDESWKTGDPHDLPDIKEIDGGIDSVNLLVATLSTAMGAVTKVKGSARAARKEVIYREVNRGETPMMVMKKEPEQVPDEHRIAGARVLMALEPVPNKTATFEFYDGTHRKLPNSLQPSNLLPQYSNLVAANTALMKNYERFWMKKDRE